jgi:hypothetical protein
VWPCSQGLLRSTRLPKVRDTSANSFFATRRTGSGSMSSTAWYGSFSSRSASSSSARSTSVSARLGSSCRHSAAARCCSRSCRSRFKCPPAPHEGSCCFTTIWSSEGSATRLRCMWSVPNRADPGVNRGRRRDRPILGADRDGPVSRPHPRDPASPTEARQYWARIGTTSGVINVSRARFAAMKSGVTRHFGRSRPDDHEIRITSLVILVICLFEQLGHI